MEPLGIGDGSEKAEVSADGRNNVDADSDDTGFRHVAEASRRHGGGELRTGSVRRHGFDEGEEMIVGEKTVIQREYNRRRI